MIIEAVEKAGINELITSALTIPVFGTGARVILPMTSQVVPLYALAFLVGGVGSFAGDIVHLIVGELPVSKKFEKTSDLVTGVVVNAGLFAGVLYMVDPAIASDFGTFTSLAIGGAGEFLGAASYNYLKQNLYI